MNRYNMPIAAIFSALCSGLVPNHSAVAQSISDEVNSGAMRVEVNGSAVRFVGQGPIEEDGRALVPLRGVLEKLGAYVEYDATTRDILATRKDTRIEMQIGEREARVNGRTVRMTVPARVVRGSVLVPLRFVAEALGADVRYNDERRLIKINLDNGEAIVDRPGTNDADSFTGKIRQLRFTTTPKSVTVTLDRPTGSTDTRTLDVTGGTRVLRRRKDNSEIPIDFEDLRRNDEVEVTESTSGRVTKIVLERRPGAGIGGDGAQGEFVGTVSSTRPNATPRTIIVNVSSFPGADGGARRRTFEVSDSASVSQRLQNGETRKYTFGRIRSGDRVTLILNNREIVTEIYVEQP